MVKLSARIEDLQKNTGSLEVKKICENALSEISKINKTRISPSAKKELAISITENVIDELSGFDESIVESFIKKEKTALTLDNLGISEAMDKIAESDLKNHPAISYAIRGFQDKLSNPDYLIAEEFYSKFKPFDWHPQVKSELDNIFEKVTIYKDDIIIQKAVHGLKNSKSSYLLKGINETLEAYLEERTKKNKEELVERLDRFSFDHMIRNLKNAVQSSNDNELVIKEGKGQAIPKDIYSLVFINENNEIFGTGKEFYAKSGNTLIKLNESDVSSLSHDFVKVNEFLNSDSVKIVGDTMTIYGSDRKFVLESVNGNVSITVNDKKMTNEEFQSIYMKSGVLSRRNSDQVGMINYIVENFDSITKIDFGKRILSPNMANRRVDIFKLDENIFITKEDPMMGRVDFFKNLNATQSKNLVIEYLNYDISESFTEMISSEDKQLKEYSKAKQSYIKAISKLEEKVKELSSINDPAILESEEFQNILSILNQEIDSLKEEYNSYVASIVEMETAPTASPEEDAGKDLGTETERGDFTVDDKVKCLKLECCGTITGVNGDAYTILTDDGKTEICKAEDLELLEVSESDGLEDKIDKVTKFIDKLGDGESDDEEEDDDEEEGDDDDDDEDDEDEEDEDEEGDDDEEFDVDGLDAKDPDLTTEAETAPPTTDVNDASKEVVDANDTDLTPLTAGDKINKSGKIGTVQGVKDEIATVLFDDGSTETVKTSEVSLQMKHEDSITEDHSDVAGAAPIEDLNSLTPGDRVETEDDVYGSVQGVRDDIVTVLHDDGSTESYGPGELYFVKKHEEAISEDFSAGDEVELTDGSRAKVTSTIDDKVMIIDDQGKTSTVPKSDLNLIKGIGTQADEVEGKENDGKSVDV